jgi:RHS repeat-associated protein
MNIQRKIFATLLLLVASFTSAQTVEYIHTDALGSPVAVTNASGVVIERTVYEPYGQVLNRPLNNRPGYTGHVEDAVTGLNYMQQRYYDPQLGRFLSNDPVTASSVGGNFNRYWYGNNNPYKYRDPTGEVGELALRGLTAFIAADTMIPEPTDVAWPKWAGYAVGAGVLTGIVWATSDSSLGDAVPTDKPIVENRSKPAGPDPDAEGLSHSVPDGNGGYTTYGPRDPVTGQPESTKQYRPEGKAHGPVPRPNVKDRPANPRPDGAKVPGKPEVRQPTPEEIRKPKVDQT